MYGYPDTSFTIMCFTWNSSGLKLCETTSVEQADKNRQGFLAFISGKKQCVVPDFFNDISALISKNLPSLVIMTTQDEDDERTYFHSDLLQSTMPKLEYTLLRKDKLSGVGDDYNIYDRVPTGEPTKTALRMSIYAHNSVAKHLLFEEKIMLRSFNNDFSMKCQQGDNVSGAIVSYVWHEKYGKFAFIAVHLPSNVNSTLQSNPNIDYTSFRATTKSKNSLCLLNIYNKFVSSLDQKERPDHVFLLGDLNYDIVIPKKTNMEIQTLVASNLTIAKIKELQRFDELSVAIKEVPLIGFKEGVSSEGPLFIPTWKFVRYRPDSCNNDSSISRTCFPSVDEQVGGIGWHDRILYRELMTSNYIAHCSSYNRMDIKNMHLSTNAGVIGFFEMKPVQ